MVLSVPFSAVLAVLRERVILVPRLVHNTHFLGASAVGEGAASSQVASPWASKFPALNRMQRGVDLPADGSFYYI